MRVLIIIAMILVAGFSAWLAASFVRVRQWPGAVLFSVISLFTGALVVAGFFGWVGG